MNTECLLRVSRMLTMLCCAMSVTAAQTGLSARIDGTFLIGAMFPIHNLHEGGTCGDVIQDQAGIQNLEALLYAIDTVNNEILKGLDFKLGTLAYDTCYSDTEALKRAQQYVTYRIYTLEMDSMYKCADSSSPLLENNRTLIGVVGAATSVVSIQLASFFRLFKIPQISYSATSTELSDTSRYDFFMRTVASDTHQARAIVDILKRFQWTYVTCVYEDTSYGERGYQELVLASKEKICIAEAVKVKRFVSSEDANQLQLEDAIKSLRRHNNTEGKTVVILFASSDIVNKIFRIVDKMEFQNHFQWVGSDDWTGRSVPTEVQDIVEGTIGVQHKIRIIPDFDKYFLKLRPDTNTRNPWFKKYWEQIFNCSFVSNDKKKHVPSCDPNLELSEKGKYQRNQNTYSTMDAVYAFAYALKEWHRRLCGQMKGVCTAMKEAKPEDLMLQGYLKNVTFKDPAGFEFKFNNTDGPVRYSVLHYFRNESVYKWREVGDIDGNAIRWIENNGSLGYRASTCSSPCRPGEAKLPIAGRNCCWSCRACAQFEYLHEENQTCIACQAGTTTNQSKNGCADIPEKSMNMRNKYVIIFMAFVCLGIVVTCLIAVLFYWHRDTPLIMASGKELSFVLLFGVVLSYASTFAFVAYPTATSCAFTRVLLGLSYTICYAAILVKTNRIYRVFNIHTKKPKKVTLISAKSQLLVTSAIVFVEILVLLLWLIFVPADVVYEHPTPADNVRSCGDARGHSYIISLIYPLLLMIACIYYAVRTRKTPDGFNETRYIEFGSYSFSILWIAFIAMYVSVSNIFARVGALCFFSAINATITLITLFVTKAYIVLLKPQKNTRENVMARRRTFNSYENVDIRNLSLKTSAVSNWHPSHPVVGSQTSSMINGQVPKKYGPNLPVSISAINLNNISKSVESLDSVKSVCSDLPDHPIFVNEDIHQYPVPVRISTDLGDLRLKEFLEKSHEYNSDEDTGPGIISGGVPRRSLRSFRSRKQRRHTMKRTKSLNAAHNPTIVVTSASNEDISARFKVIHL
ncbi:metabotropic glutamate receptor-like [Dreissena polymorpha]|nr:metabotropic glutamate receptor-like [Dreissena polymorpha]